LLNKDSTAIMREDDAYLQEAVADVS